MTDQGLAGAPPRRWMPHLVAVLGVAVQSAGSTACLAMVAFITARELGPQDRGVIVLVVTTSTFAMLFGTAGANYVARARLAAPVPLPLPAFNAVAAVLCAAALPLGAVGGWLVLSLTDVPLSLPGALGIGVYTALLLVVLFEREVLNALGKNLAAARVEFAGGLVQLLVVAVAVYALDVRSAVVVLALIVASVALQGLLGAWEWRRASLSFAVTWQREAFLAILRQGRGGLGIALAQALSLRFDRIVLGVVTGTAAVGVYSVAATLTELLWFLPIALGHVASAMVARRSITPGQLQRLRLLTIVVALASAAVVYFAAEPLIRGLFGDEYSGATEPLRVLLLASVPASLYLLDVLCLNALGATGTAGKAACAGAVVAMGLAVLLIPAYDLMGAAYASLAGYTAMAVLVAWGLRSQLRNVAW